MKWFTKRTYSRISEALGAIYQELQALQPVDTDSIKWTYSVDGVKAYTTTGNTTGSIAQTNTTEDVAVAVIDPGHFRIVEWVDPADQINKVAVINNSHSTDPVTADPSICTVQYIRNANDTSSKISTTYSVDSWLSSSPTWADGLHYIYLAMPFRAQPYIVASQSIYSETEALDFYILGTVLKTGLLFYVVQEYDGDALTYHSYSYCDAFKLIDTSYMETIPPEEEGGESTQEEQGQIQVIHGASAGEQFVYVNNAHFELPNTFNVAATRGDYIYIKVVLSGESGTISVESGASVPQSQGRSIYYVLGSLSATHGVSQQHMGPDVRMKWYIICDEEEEA